MTPLTRDQFVELVLAELDSVDRLARSLSRPPDSDDLVQETYLRALRSWETFKLADYGVRPWLYKILHNVYRTRLERDARQPRSADSEVLDASHAAPPPVEAPISAAISPDTDVGAALARLDPDLRAILVLWGVDELSYREMADVLDIPIGTVMSRLHRARRKLAELLPSEVRDKLPPNTRRE